MSSIKNLPKVDMSDIGFYIRLINLDYNPKNNEELAELITENFNVHCTDVDIEHYEELQFELEEQSRAIFDEDFELEDRKQQYFQASW